MFNGSTFKVLFVISIMIGSAGILNGVFDIYHYAPKTVIETPGDKNKINVSVPRVPGLKCPEGWKRTGGTDPDLQTDLISCTDGRYIVTTREGGGTAALDTFTGNFVSPKTIPAYQ